MIGKTLGHYRSLAEAGAGGMGSDGEQFMVITAAAAPSIAREIRVVLNWFERLRELD